MSESVTLPALGESVTEGTVTRWLKQVGDQVEVDEPLLEVSTDKVDTEIPSPVAGVVEEILVQEDETVEVGTALVKIGDGSGAGGGGSEPAPQPEEAESAPVDSTPQPAPQQVVQNEPEEVAEAGSSYTEPEPEREVAQQPQDQGRQQDQGGQPPLAQEATSSTEADLGQDEAPAAAPTAPPTPAQPAPVQAAAPAPAAAPRTPGAAPTASAQPSGGAGSGSHAAAPYVTPIVRKLAHDRGVDLGSVQGSGVGGRIRKEDVLAAAETQGASQQQTTAAPAAKPEPSPLRGTTVKMSRLRKVVAERAVVSMQSTAQLTTVVEADVTAVAALRDRVKGEFQQKTGQKLSFLPFFALAAVEALQQYPIINATVDGDSIVYPDTENLSIAVDTERGLLTPVVRNASSLSIAELAAQIADLASRTRENKLKPDELAGGTFTLTNTGSRGALFDTPLVFLPQVAILGTGTVQKLPRVVKTADGAEAIAVRSVVYLALSYDHRIVDGADAARFLSSVRARLEGGDFTGSLGI
ncbi:2-oxoglutarate dehydrogenase, E2 component, dihydrolipoamide succinyltransferase [Amnibacterium sp. CER49]|uniref:2-oxoglutarate dehydrogenase, E2 component, dihydrolipoamide succinyltransferase n=1 Tax=Amnibacterium sp. CER49 TaxID=3039161 RepID=UPI002446C6D3|nr:2-oxoglutarate dehydrogenase, E2 component, dihydrolipoamide succinyltransferase [Amnibacterium sp. CER49]MDH2442339.1 2-oxoglutarate dehydrogenase, E2 component, dihydrolipoamide succinyltransferase [Amnibacterium sp. CER49]